MSKMDRRQFVAGMIASTSAMAMSQDGLAAGLSGRKPNFVFVFIDDMGWTDLGFMGSTYYETPNIDRLAKQGMVFTNAYANAPNCAPTRASLITGQYTPRHGVYTVGTSERGEARFRKLIPIQNNTSLASDAVTIPEALKTGGYVSACIGKWHLGNAEPHRPEDQGFDYVVKRGGNENDKWVGAFTQEALKFIEANRDDPFFLYLAHHAVHVPLQAKEDLVSKYEKKPGTGGHKNPVYAAMVESVDWSVGRIMEKLDQLNLADNTVVVFFSDNGGVGGYEELGARGGGITSNRPLRGGKGMLYEGGIRVPMIVRWPGEVKAGSTCDTPVIGLDFYPTFLDVAGLQAPPDHILDGESLLPLLKQAGALKRDAVFWHFPAYLQRGRGTWRTTPAGAIRERDFKLIEFFEDGRLELYNLRDDIGEKSNLAEALPEKTRQLHRLLIDWRRSVEAPVPTDPNPDYAPDAPPDEQVDTQPEAR